MHLRFLLALPVPDNTLNAKQVGEKSRKRGLIESILRMHLVAVKTKNKVVS
jgi:hypothetical protein